ncbi:MULTISPECIES: PIN domain-containing protein [Methylosinus]|uniref:PIN domain-containing protein n=1 Tax=Methylosinus trichosporium (strain ATCC 35070 / NCIMB 11131 / UNIQEM 75 / OB3b) TaxID=595536 RepID=A0A2D2D2L5_METT3|nr:MULTISPECIES: PIN domain-containing protein [Methylosinus]ATQ69218.1 PIN domain-containing protein [Methylosinus trichosporium OB3b]OBS53297.1 hypothetical protein A8B73_06875 [Methylosinus sp. 3S-1]
MPVIFDTSFLAAMLDPKVQGGGDADIDERLRFLLSGLDKEREVVIVPTPALSEALIGAGDAAPQYLEILNKSARFRVAPFGERAAVEAAAAHREAIRAGDKKEGSASWAKVKFDRQIIAIARVEGVTRIYSNDSDIRRYLAGSGEIEVIKMEDLPSPPEPPRDLLSPEKK